MTKNQAPVWRWVNRVVLSGILVCLLILIAQNRSTPPTDREDAARTFQVSPPIPRPAPPRMEGGSETASTKGTTNEDNALEPTDRGPTKEPLTSPTPSTVRYEALVTHSLVHSQDRSVESEASPVSTALAAEIIGHVQLSGTPPPERPITLDPVCGRFYPDGLTTRFYAVGSSGALADGWWQPIARPVSRLGGSRFGTGKGLVWMWC